VFGGGGGGGGKGVKRSVPRQLPRGDLGRGGDKNRSEAKKGRSPQQKRKRARSVHRALLWKGWGEKEKEDAPCTVNGTRSAAAVTKRKGESDRND